MESAAGNPPHEEPPLQPPVPRALPRPRQPFLAPSVHASLDRPVTLSFSGELQYKEALRRVLEEVHSVEREVFLNEEFVLRSREALSECLSTLRNAFQAVQSLSVSYLRCAWQSPAFEEKMRLTTIDILTNILSLEGLLKTLQQQQRVVPVQRVLPSSQQAHGPSSCFVPPAP